MLLPSLALLAVVAPPPEPAYGDAGTLSPSGVVGLSFEQFRTTDPMIAPDEQISLLLAPGVDYFVLDDIAVSAAFELGYTWGSFADFRTLGLSLGGAYNVRITDRVSLVPRVALAVGHYKTFPAEVTVRPDGTTMVWRFYAPPNYLQVDLRIGLPLLVHFGHFFLGVGPRLSQRLITRVESGFVGTEFYHRRTSFAFATTLGGWL